MKSMTAGALDEDGEWVVLYHTTSPEVRGVTKEVAHLKRFENMESAETFASTKTYYGFPAKPHRSHKK